MRKFAIVCALALLPTFVGSVSAQTPDSVRQNVAAAPKGRLLGVFDQRSGDPIEGVRITDLKTKEFALTTETGTISLGFLQPAGSMIKIQKMGFRDTTFIVADPMNETPITITLGRVAATELPAVVTTEKYRLDTDPGKWDGFERRCGVAHVSCFREEDLAARPTSTILDIIKRADGISELCTGLGTNSYKVRGGRADNNLPTCVPKMLGGICYYVDGFRRDPSIPNQPYLTYSEIAQFLGPTQIKGIEVYRPEINPLSFGGGAGLCGSVVIWTKQAYSTSSRNNQ